MDKRTPVSAYKLFSSPSNKQIVFDSFYETPCINSDGDYSMVVVVVMVVVGGSSHGGGGIGLQ